MDYHDGHYVELPNLFCVTVLEAFAILTPHKEIPLLGTRTNGNARSYTLGSQDREDTKY